VVKAPEEVINCKIIDKDDGSYSCSYTINEECAVNIEILFENEKGDMVHIRGSPYHASFVASAKPADNLMTGGALDRHIKKELERLQHSMTEGKKEMNTKDKDLKDVKVLLAVKDVVDNTFKNQDTTTLHIDQLDEALMLFTAHKLSKDAQIKGFNKINKEWNDIKALAKQTRKDIQPLVATENDKNNREIKRLEDDITTFTQEMKKREFFQYKCGCEQALIKLDAVFSELNVFENQIADYGENAKKFGNPTLIEKAIKDIEAIKITIDNMKELWDHIDTCSKIFK
jgi:hypothetical protein